MKQAAKLLDTQRIKQGSYSESTTQAGNPTEQDKLFVNQLFLELAGIFPAWRQAFEGADGVRVAKRVWMNALIDSKINSMEKIKTGLKEAAKSENPFMPSVGQFISWCKIGDRSWETKTTVLALDNPSKPETDEKNLSKMMESLK